MGQRSSRLSRKFSAEERPFGDRVVPPKKVSEPCMPTAVSAATISDQSSSIVDRRRTKSDAKFKQKAKPGQLATKSELPPKENNLSAQLSEFDSPVHLSINNYQISALQLGWLQARAKGSREPALSIFRHFFNETTEIQSSFNRKSRYNGDESILQVHINSFNHLMDEVLKHLGDERRLVPILLKIGRKHSHFRQSGFKPTMWDKLAEILVETSLGWNLKRGRNLESQAWTNVILFLVGTMNEGYKRERIRMRDVTCTPT